MACERRPAVSIQTAWQATFDFWGQPIVVEPSKAQLSSDGGLLPFRQFDEQIGLTRQFAEALHDDRVPGLIDHTFLEMVRSRVYGVLAAYEDQNDHDTLRYDPIFKLIADRSPDADPLASQPTLSRFENAIGIPSLKRLRDVFIDQFIRSFATPPKHLTFDLDAVDDPAHGEQQLVLFHGYFNQYQYFPSFITCADNDQTVVLSLRPGAMHAALGADDDLEYLVRRLRQAWPGVHIHVRGDAGYGVPWMYRVCERREHRLHLWHSCQQRSQKTQRSLARTSPSQLGSHRAAATFVRRLLVSSWHLVDGTLGDRQGRGQRPRHQPTFRRQQSLRSPHHARGRLRRLCSTRRSRKPQQRTQVRPEDRLHQRSSFPCELLSALSARRRQ